MDVANLLSLSKYHKAKHLCWPKYIKTDFSFVNISDKYRTTVDVLARTCDLHRNIN